MMKTLARRKQLAIALLGIAIIVATYVAIPHDPFYDGLYKVKSKPTQQAMGVVADLNRQEFLHILGHVMTFGAAALLLGGWGAEGERGSASLGLRYALIGAAVMEGAQIFVHYLPAAYLYLTERQVSPLLAESELWKTFFSTVFDFGVNLAAALGGLGISERYAQRITLAAMRLGLA